MMEVLEEDGRLAAEHHEKEEEKERRKGAQGLIVRPLASS